MEAIRILGGGLAGSAAAIAALSESAAVHVFERSTLPRHKVCGEFLSPGAARILETLGVWQDFMRLEPSRIRRCVLHFGSRTKSWTLPECAFGLSRYELDRLLLERARQLGATVEHAQAAVPEIEAGGKETMVVATGRPSLAPRGNRLFGFKAHFDGPTDDAVALFLSRDCYAGVSAVENGITNVCGIAPESVLREHNFQMDELLDSWEPLRERTRPLTRRMRWLTTGPLVFTRNPDAASHPNLYPAGDALGFVDPFTGTGMLNALLTGRMAGLAAARRTSSQAYLRECHRALAGPFRAAALFRAALRWGWAGALTRLVPGNWLFHLTRAVDFRFRAG